MPGGEGGRGDYRRKTHKSLSGIETTATRLWIQLTLCRKTHKSLSGIETLLTSTSRYFFCSSRKTHKSLSGIETFINSALVTS